MNRFTNFTKILTFTFLFTILHGTVGITDDAFVPYVKEFEKVCKIKTGSIVSFGNNFEKNVIGYCTPSNKNIKINKRYWDTATDYEKEMLIFHELGHCDLDRDHKEGWYIQIVDGKEVARIPISIMGAQLFYVNTYITHRDYYLEELFGKN